MPKTIRLRVLTAQGLAIEEEATSLIAPGEVGYLGILKNHAPLVTTLNPGTLTWKRQDGERKTARLGRGILEVVKNQVTILTDQVSAPTSVAAERML